MERQALGFRKLALLPLAACAILLILSACGKGVGAPAGGNGKPGRVLLIGVDGATWDVIDPLLRNGRMPNFERLRRAGAGGPLQSIPPTISPIVWTTIATGRKPEDHGILGFVKNEESGKQVHYTNADRRVRAIWNILSDRGRGVNVVGWFTSWPADIVKGAFISDRSEAPLSGGVYPSDLEPMIARTSNSLTGEQVRKQVEPFLGPPIAAVLSIEEQRTYKRYEDSLEHYYRVDKLRLEWALELLRDRPADLTAVFFKGTDPMSHLTWAYMDPEPFRSVFRPTDEARLRFGPVIARYYEFVDRAVGQLAAAAGADTDLIVVSDHGSGPATALLAYHVNPVLARLGWVSAEEDGHPNPERSILIDPTPTGREGQTSRRLTFNRHLLAERAPDRAQRERLVREMSERLRELRTVEGEPLFTEALVTGEEGGAADGSARYALDVRINDRFSQMRRTERGLEVAGEYSIAEARYPLTDLVSVRWERTGGHRIDGIILMAGPRIRPGVAIGKASVYDVTPTMLHVLGLPQAKDMQGRVIEEALRTDILPPTDRPIASYETGEEIHRVQAPPMPEIEEELEKRLRTLGYIQ